MVRGPRACHHLEVRLQLRAMVAYIQLARLSHWLLLQGKSLRYLVVLTVKSPQLQVRYEDRRDVMVVREIFYRTMTLGKADHCLGPEQLRLHSRDERRRWHHFPLVLNRVSHLDLESREKITQLQISRCLVKHLLRRGEEPMATMKSIRTE